MNNRLAWTLILAVLSIKGATAEVIYVPAVTILELTHESTPWEYPHQDQKTVRDGVKYPYDPGVLSGPAFTASIGQGDTVIIRIQAPPGERFLVTPHPDAISNYFGFGIYWQAGADSTSHYGPVPVQFENLSGTAPTMTYGFDALSDGGNVVHAQHQFSFTAPFSFTAAQVQFTVSHAVAKVPRNYSSVRSSATWTFSASSLVTVDASNRTIMSIEPVPSPGTGAMGMIGLAMLALWRRRVA